MPADVKSGVPQGSVLGPLLFLVLIGDIDREVTTSFVSSFADDTRAVNGISTNADVCDLQVDLDAIYHWADENNMEFNNTKFECLRYGNQLCGWVLRTFNTRKTLPMMTLWKTLIRSRLDYCCQLWCPSKKGDVQALEQLQRQYIRKISGVQHLTYWQQLKCLSLNSLERRRERYIIMYVWRILERHAQYRKSLTICHKLEAATHGHLGTEPGNHRQVSTSISVTFSLHIFIMFIPHCKYLFFDVLAPGIWFTML